MELRDYQKKALNTVTEKKSAGITRQIISMPTGTGKTVVFASLIALLDVQTLVLAHRDELLAQAKEMILNFFPNDSVGILSGETHIGLEKQVCVASIQTAIRHTSELKERGFKLIICDEAHHAASNSYKRLFSDLGFMNGDNDKLLVGFTATAYRGDGVGLDSVFQEKVFNMRIEDAIQNLYLCDLKGLRVSTQVDISGLKYRAGDFLPEELSYAVNTPERNKLIVDTYKQYGEGRRGIIFCVDVNHAKDLAKAFQMQEFCCEAVWGNMPKEERADILKRYVDGELRLITNVGVLTEGWDCPDTSIIMMARPTKSKVLYVQCVGRGLRIAPGKKDCLLIDFVDVSKKLDLCGVETIVGKPVKYHGDRMESILAAVKSADEQTSIDKAVQAPSAKYSHFNPIPQPMLPSTSFPWCPVQAIRYATQGSKNGNELWVSQYYDNCCQLFLLIDHQLLFYEIKMNAKDFIAQRHQYEWKSAPAYCYWLDLTAQNSGYICCYPCFRDYAYAMWWSTSNLAIPFNWYKTMKEALTTCENWIKNPSTSKQQYRIRKDGLNPHPETLTKSEAWFIINQKYGNRAISRQRII